MPALSAGFGARGGEGLGSITHLPGEYFTRYFHVVDPRTGLEVVGQGSVTVVAPGITSGQGYV